jgi:hypothetical protein
VRRRSKSISDAFEGLRAAAGVINVAQLRDVDPEPPTTLMGAFAETTALTGRNSSESLLDTADDTVDGGATVGSGVAAVFDEVEHPVANNVAATSATSAARPAPGIKRR